MSCYTIQTPLAYCGGSVHRPTLLADCVLRSIVFARNLSVAVLSLSRITTPTMATSSNPPPKTPHPLPLSSTLHDLALLRASDLDFSSLLTKDGDGASDSADSTPEVEQSVQRSMEFSREARAALKLAHTDAVERQGARVDEARARLEDVVKGLDASDA